jgi:hypothetical protein
MFLGAWWRDEEDSYTNEQQEGRTSSFQAQNASVQQSSNLPKKAGRAMWDKETPDSTAQGSIDTPPAAGDQDTKKKSGTTQEETDDEGSFEEGKKEGVSETVEITTLGDAFEYCSSLVEIQLQRAHKENPPMNKSIYGDTNTKKTIFTLLPDQLIRNLFISTTTRDKTGLFRLKPLFGAPPYSFLNPQDSGMIRAAGMSTGRVNMTYDIKSVPPYEQFGAGHVVDDFMREYKLIPHKSNKSVDSLPFDLENDEKYVHMIVRVRKRRCEAKVALNKDPQNRKSIVFPVPGEVLNIRYSDVLKKIWAKKANDESIFQILVTRLIFTSSRRNNTAALIGLKVYR